MNSKEIDKVLNTVLNLDYEVVGLKLLNSEEDYKKEWADEVLKPVRYCVMVKSAALGHNVKIKSSQFRCNGSGTSFGYWDVDQEYLSGEKSFRTGLHKSVEVSKEVVQDMYRLDGDNYGMVIKPLHQFDERPDNILIVSNTYNAMRLAQGYTYKYGLKKDFNIAGNQAMCYEASVVPMVEKDMNISMLCAGTRHAAQWKDTDLVVGISDYIIEDVLEGVIKTINTVEPDDKKRKIIERNGSPDILDVHIDMHSAYFYSGTFVTKNDDALEERPNHD